ncbi:MAG TPA: alpha/beta hydrolase [Syntrophomonas sp.]|nr:alpha/beta hydrolase [Syntrophomonas sp.]
MADFIENTGNFVGLDNTQIYYHSWKVDRPRGIIVIVHGIGEHSGRYGNLIKTLADAEISIYALDHRGHGHSEGKRGHINAFAEYTDDLKTLFKLINTENQDLPIILLGHSMGGVIACQYALLYPHDLSGLILSSAGFITAARVPGWKKGLAKLLSKLAPSFSMPTGLNSNDLSHDQTVVEAYLADPLVHDKVSSRWFIEFNRAGADCLRRAAELTMPLLIIHGAEDKIVDPQGSQQVMARASSPDKKLYLFKGLYHETMNELPAEKKKVLNTIRAWIIKHVESR